MIAWIRGKLLEKEMEGVVVDVQGVGYRLYTSLHTFYDLPDPGEDVALRAQMVVRDDAIHLYGFLTEAEREAFRSLIGVSGIGPRLARNILSGIRAEELAMAVRDGNGGRLQAIPGVGKRMAERILLELQGKMAHLASPEVARVGPGGPGGRDEAIEEDVLSALSHLGYRKAEISKVLPAAREAVAGELTLEAWVRETLRLLAR
jgi:Holliday junction DNA helicase RuvA